MNIGAEGDRVQFRAPDTQKRIANGEVGAITKIDPNQIRLNLDSGREKQRAKPSNI